MANSIHGWDSSRGGVTTEGCLPPNVIYHWRSSSTEGCLPLKVVFHRRSSFTTLWLRPGCQGARLPWNLQAHTKFLQQFTLFWCEFDFKVFLYFLSNKGILPITHNMQEILFFAILPKQVINYHKKKFLVTKRNLLSRAEISWHKKKFLFTGRNLFSQEEIYFHRKKFLALEEMFCHRKKLLVTGRNFMPQLEISCHRKKFVVTGRNFFLFILGQSWTLKFVSTTHPPATRNFYATSRLGRRLKFVDFTHKYEINQGVMVGRPPSLGWSPSNYNLFNHT